MFTENPNRTIENRIVEAMHILVVHLSFVLYEILCDVLEIDPGISFKHRTVAIIDNVALKEMKKKPQIIQWSPQFHSESISPLHQ